MKKIKLKKCALLAIVSISLAFGGCGRANEEPASEPPAEQTAAPTEDPNLVVIDKIENPDGTGLTLLGPEDMANTPAPEPEPTPTPELIADPEPTQSPEAAGTPVPVPTLAPEMKKFSLSANEQKIFDDYLENKNHDVFKDVPQISIAKVFLSLGINGHFEHEFSMYAPDTLQMTWEEYEKASQGVIPLEQRQYIADVMFGNMDAGKFVDEGGGKGYIEFTSQTTEPEDAKFNLVQNDKGIWLIMFNPFS